MTNIFILSSIFSLYLPYEICVAPSAKLDVVSGVVMTGYNMQPCPNASILIYNEKFQQEVVSNSKGEFFSPKMKPGKYKLLVKVTGYQSAHFEIKVSRFSKKNKFLSIMLYINSCADIEVVRRKYNKVQDR